MVKVIYGGQGSGKTARLVEEANATALTAKGIVAYVDKGNGRMHDLDHAVKLINARDFKIQTAQELGAFIKGMVAGNYDIETVFIDNVEKLTGSGASGLEILFINLEDVAQIFKVNFIITLNREEQTPPDFLKKYIYFS